MFLVLIPSGKVRDEDKEQDKDEVRSRDVIQRDGAALGGWLDGADERDGDLPVVAGAQKTESVETDSEPGGDDGQD